MSIISNLRGKESQYNTKKVQLHIPVTNITLKKAFKICYLPKVPQPKFHIPELFLPVWSLALGLYVVATQEAYGARLISDRQRQKKV